MTQIHIILGEILVKKTTFHIGLSTELSAILKEKKKKTGMTYSQIVEQDLRRVYETPRTFNQLPKTIPL